MVCGLTYLPRLGLKNYTNIFDQTSFCHFQIHQGGGDVAIANATREQQRSQAGQWWSEVVLRQQECHPGSQRRRRRAWRGPSCKETVEARPGMQEKNRAVVDINLSITCTVVVVCGYSDSLEGWQYIRRFSV